MSLADIPDDVPASARIIVGMSGGVDSSVAAYLLQQSGFVVEGLFMKNWEEDDGTPYCTAKQDLADAEAVCGRLGIPLHQANFASEYWDNVFAHFLAEYKVGRTPNPDILCNREIKFNVFREYAEFLQADFIATGHYARLVRVAGQQTLQKAVDTAKDQSYFLQSVSEAQLEHCLFPLGTLRKTEVRQIAESAAIPTFAKKDSTGICFIGERRFRDFLQQYLPPQPGPIVTVEGDPIGTHAGLMYHTLGQRQGLGIGGKKGAGEAPWYVVDKDQSRNTLIVAQGNDHPALLATALVCQDIQWIDGVGPDLPGRLQVKTRYRQPDQAAVLERDAGGYRVRFDQPQRAITPGQWACFYDGEVCLGGGVIDSRG
jgi:tRNA-uridine 2-sulfurtransferase